MATEKLNTTTFEFNGLRSFLRDPGGMMGGVSDQMHRAGSLNIGRRGQFCVGDNMGEYATINTIGIITIPSSAQPNRHALHRGD